MTDRPHTAIAPDPAAVDAGGHPEPSGHTAEPEHDEHGHGEEPIGPIDTAAWLAGALGIALGIAVTICFVLATGEPTAVPA